MRPYGTSSPYTATAQVVGGRFVRTARSLLVVFAFFSGTARGEDCSVPCSTSAITVTIEQESFTTDATIWRGCPFSATIDVKADPQHRVAVSNSRAKASITRMRGLALQ